MSTLDLRQIERLKRLQSTPGDSFVQDLVDLFVEQSRLQMAKMKQLADGRETNELTKLAHQLKSASANLGAVRFSEICAALERADLQANSEIALTHLGDLEIEFDRVCRELKALNLT